MPDRPSPPARPPELWEMDWFEILDALDEGVMLVGEDGRIAHCNVALADRLGRSRAEVLAQPLFGAVAPERRTQLVLDIEAARGGRLREHVGELSIGEGDPVAVHMRLRHAMFRGRPHVLALVRVGSGEGDPSGAGGADASVPLSRLTTLAERFVEAQRLSAKEDLAAAVAHSINNPLAALIGMATMLVESSPTPDPMAQRIVHLAGRIRKVVDGTLRLFRRGALELTPERPADMIREVAALLRETAAARGITVETDFDEGLPTVIVDRSMIHSALVCLAENAIDAMRDGGMLRFEAELMLEPQVLELRVVDTGPGIPEELRQKVLEPFFTTKGGGTGLGLSIASGIVQGHRGRMRIESPPAGGTCVVIELPVLGFVRHID